MKHPITLLILGLSAMALVWFAWLIPDRQSLPPGGASARNTMANANIPIGNSNIVTTNASEAVNTNNVTNSISDVANTNTATNSTKVAANANTVNQNASVPPPTVTISDVLAAPGRYLAQRIRIIGTVRYGWPGGKATFGTYQLVDAGAAIRLQSWLPDGVAPCSSAAGECQVPPSMPDYLDQRLALTATVQAIPAAEYETEHVTTGPAYRLVEVADVTPES